jgi:hypothetical protein
MMQQNSLKDSRSSSLVQKKEVAAPFAYEPLPRDDSPARYPKRTRSSHNQCVQAERAADEDEDQDEDGLWLPVAAFRPAPKIGRKSTQGGFLRNRNQFSRNEIRAQKSRAVRDRRVNRPKHNHSREAKDILRDWFYSNVNSPGGPYPSDEIKDELAERTGLTRLQITNFFINERKRVPGWRQGAAPQSSSS